MIWREAVTSLRDSWFWLRLEIISLRVIVRSCRLRTAEPLYEHERIFKGRGGLTQNTRPYHLYILKSEGVNSVVIDGRLFVSYEKKYLDVRGGGKVSKAQRIFNFVQEHTDRAFFSKDVAEALKDYGVNVRDVMSNVRRFERARATDQALKGKASSSPLMERAHHIRDMVIEHSKIRKLVSFTYLENKLDCTPHQAELAVARTLQLYPQT